MRTGLPLIYLMVLIIISIFFIFLFMFVFVFYLAIHSSYHARSNILSIRRNIPTRIAVIEVQFSFTYSWKQNRMIAMHSPGDQRLITKDGYITKCVLYHLSIRMYPSFSIQLNENLFSMIVITIWRFSLSDVPQEFKFILLQKRFLFFKYLNMMHFIKLFLYLCKKGFSFLTKCHLRY